MRCVVGLEVEWYLLRLAEDHLTDENIGAPGMRARPVHTWPVEPGYSYHSESNMDLMQPVLSALAEAYEQIGLPLRSLENEWGPGQVECTFAAEDALKAADDLILFRTATRQVCRRLGYFATFMCRPGLKGYYSSGWHLHQSLVDAGTGAQPADARKPGTRSCRRSAWATSAGWSRMRRPAPPSPRRPSMATAASGRIRWRPTAPDGDTTIAAPCCASSAASAIPARGSRTASASRPPIPISTSLRRSSPGATASSNKRDPGPQDDEPYAAERPPLPASLTAALDALDGSALFRAELGDTFIDYFLKLKRNEAGRFTALHGRDRDGPAQATKSPHGSRTNISTSSDARPRLQQVSRRQELMSLDGSNRPQRPLGHAPLPYDWDELVQEDRVHRLIYTAPAIFAAEMTHIFGGVWTYLAHESQIPDNDDYVTARLGLRPLIVVRDSGGNIRALYNRCTHRGTTLCREDQRLGQGVPVPLSRLDLHQHGRAARRAVAGRLRLRLQATRNSISRRCRAWKATAASSSARSTPTCRRSPTISAQSASRSTNGSTATPAAASSCCEANRLKFKGNWKLAYDNSCDGYHVMFSHRSLLETENRLDEGNDKGMSYYKEPPDDAPMYVQYLGHGHHFKDKRPNVEKRPGALWAIEGAASRAWSTYEEEVRRRLGDARRARARPRRLRSRSTSTCSPTCSILGNHIQVIEPVSRRARPTPPGTAPPSSTNDDRSAARRT